MRVMAGFVGLVQPAAAKATSWEALTGLAPTGWFELDGDASYDVFSDSRDEILAAWVRALVLSLAHPKVRRRLVARAQQAEDAAAARAAKLREDAEAAAAAAPARRVVRAGAGVGGVDDEVVEHVPVGGGKVDMVTVQNVTEGNAMLRQTAVTREGQVIALKAGHVTLASAGRLAMVGIMPGKDYKESALVHMRYSGDEVQAVDQRYQKRRVAVSADFPQDRWVPVIWGDTRGLYKELIKDAARLGADADFMAAAQTLVDKFDTFYDDLQRHRSVEGGAYYDATRAYDVARVSLLLNIVWTSGLRRGPDDSPPPEFSWRTIWRDITTGVLTGMLGQLCETSKVGGHVFDQLPVRAPRLEQTPFLGLLHHSLQAILMTAGRWRRDSAPFSPEAGEDAHPHPAPAQVPGPKGGNRR
jgi:hypothetical protein